MVDMSMVDEVIFTVRESLDGGYEAKSVGHSIFTQCEKYAELQEVLRDAVKCHFDDAEMPSVIRICFVKDEIIAV
jgi:hypothetical protein